MHDPEKFQQETIKAITDLQNMLSQTQSRLLAQSAVLRAVLTQIHPDRIHQVIEEFDTGVDQLAAQLDPKYQRPKYWEEWAELLQDLQERMKKAQPPA